MQSLIQIFIHRAPGISKYAKKMKYSPKETDIRTVGSFLFESLQTLLLCVLSK